MEAALAHVAKNKAEAAYARSDLFEKRRVPMESWYSMTQWRIAFGTPVREPLALGYGCHFGLGLFGAVRNDG